MAQGTLKQLIERQGGKLEGVPDDQVRQLLAKMGGVELSRLDWMSIARLASELSRQDLGGDDPSKMAASLWAVMSK